VHCAKSEIVNGKWSRAQGEEHGAKPVHRKS
jgi:hypothetical protein